MLALETLTGTGAREPAEMVLAKWLPGAAHPTARRLRLLEAPALLGFYGKGVGMEGCSAGPQIHPLWSPRRLVCERAGAMDELFSDRVRNVTP